jgi:hypothetical protein
METYNRPIQLSNWPRRRFVRVAPHNGFSFLSDDRPERDVDSSMLRNCEAIVGSLCALLISKAELRAVRHSSP